MHSKYEAATPEKRAKLIDDLIHLPYPKKPYTSLPFGQIAMIWTEFAVEKLKSRVGPFYGLISTKAQEKLEEKLRNDLSELIAPIFNLLLNFAKMKNLLQGETPQERYLFYIEHIFPKPDYLQMVFSLFPPFTRILATAILLWIEQGAEFLTRLHGDRKELEREFKAGGGVEDLFLTLSELHSGKRLVYKLVFENGVSVIYKTKSVAIDAAFNQFLENLNELGLRPSLKTYRVIDKKEYGWVEFVHTILEQDKEQAKRYFQQLGMLICIVYLLEGTDCHSENLLCSGENPVLIDLETLFSPLVKKTSSTGLKVWLQSVFRTGFFHVNEFSGRGKTDLSPLTGEEGQELSQDVPHWQDVNTDQMKLVAVKNRVKLSVPRPKIDGEVAKTIDYERDLLHGFETMYGFFSKNKSKIIPLLEPLFKSPVRCLFRPEKLYRQMLSRVADPQLLQSEAETEKTFDFLQRYAPIADGPQLKTIVEVEKEALRLNDMPFFLSVPSNLHLYTERGKLLEDFFEKTAKERVIEKIERLDEKGMRQQMEYIEHSLYFLKTVGRIGAGTPYVPLSIKPLSEPELLHFVDRISQKILDIAHPVSDGGIGWISLEFDPASYRYSFQQVSNSLYSGYSGIALFLAAAGRKEPIGVILERVKALLYAEPMAAELTMSMAGGMIGLGSLIYSFAAIGKILHEPQYIKDASYFASLIQQRHFFKGMRCDLIGGAAGLLLSLLSLYEKTKEESLLEKAGWAANLLAATEVGGAWPMGNEGAAGISYALLKYASVSKAEQFVEVAEKSIAYERSLYSKERHNWPDLRFGKNDFGSCSWCHGAPGIGLARLYSYKLYPDEQKRREIEAAIAVTLYHLIGPIDHLCCGNFGRLAFLWEASREFDPSLKGIVEKQTAYCLQQYQEKGGFRFYQDLPGNIQSPSFMRGLSGIGYFLLKMTEPGKSLPQVLILS